MTSLSVRRLRSWVDISRGLIGYSRAIPVTFSTRWGIHTFGVRFPIDVIILDKEHRIVKMAHHLMPNRFFFWPIWHTTVIELPAGDIQRLHLAVGDTITLH